MRRVLRFILRGLIGAVALVGGLQRKPPNARNPHSHDPWRGSSDMLRLVMGKGLVLVGMGTAIGLAMSFGVERLLKFLIQYRRSRYCCLYRHGCHRWSW
jgi:hypothetical protein